MHSGYYVLNYKPLMEAHFLKLFSSEVYWIIFVYCLAKVWGKYFPLLETIMPNLNYIYAYFENVIMINPQRKRIVGHGVKLKVIAAVRCNMIQYE